MKSRAIPIALALSIGAGSAEAQQANQSGPANIATSANQQRSSSIAFAYNAAIANNATTPGAALTVAPTSIYSKFNLLILSTQSGTYTIQGSNDGFASTGLTIASGTISASAALMFTTPLTFTSYRGYYTNTSGSSATVTALASLTAN